MDSVNCRLRIPRPFLAAFLLTCGGLSSIAQTTQGLILGRVTDANSGTALAGAMVTCDGNGLASGLAVRSDDRGYFRFAFLSPGTYRVSVRAAGYQAQTLYNIGLSVAGRVDMDFALRSLRYVFDAGNYRQLSLPNNKSILPFYGPDVDTTRSGAIQPDSGKSGILEPSVSEVIDRRLLDTLPLAGRDAYALLITQPGVNADTTTGRGLGLSVNGQRLSASNYLLDGLDNNDHLTTGPLAQATPETIEEYRLTTNNFSAEFGGTSGFIANAISRPGASHWHGFGYGYFGNDVLNANTFNANANGFPRPPFKLAEPGFSVTGPLVRAKLFGSLSVDWLRLRDLGDPTPFVLPSQALLARMKAELPNSHTAQLMNEFPSVVTGGQDSSSQFGCARPATTDFVCLPLRPVDAVNRLLALPRVDAVTGEGLDHWFARLVIARNTRHPTFLYTPYPAFTGSIEDNETAAGAGWARAVTPNLTVTARAGWAGTAFLLPRAHDDVPELRVSEPGLTQTPALPGSPIQYSVRNLERRPELATDAIWSRGAHIVKFGESIVVRYIENEFQVDRTGILNFTSGDALISSQPSQVTLGVSRQDRSAAPVDNRRYVEGQFAVYAQDTVKLTSRLGFNIGVRVERFGAPRNTGGTTDAVVQLGGGSDLAAQIRTASLYYGRGQLFATPPLDWGPRVGLAYRLDDRGTLLLKGAWGIFHDQPFDNLWENAALNRIQTGTLNFAGRTWVGQTPQALVSLLQPVDVSRSNLSLTMFDQAFRTGRVQSYFAGIEKRFSPALSLEVESLGSAGQDLITTNIVNRNNGLPLFIAARSNTMLPDISYRANQGSSSYHALAAVLRYRGRRNTFQVAYTWSHSIDNQSDPIAGEFGGLSFATGASGSLTAANGDATFIQTAPSRFDRGNSDFDQRHNLVGFGSVALPSPALRALRDWRIAWVGAVRSGTPFTVLGIGGNASLENQRADVIDPAAVYRNAPGPVPGSRYILNSLAFSEPGAGTIGNSGRNAFRGPGFYSVDGSVSRNFPLRWLGEGGALTFRVDAINLLNHANLNPPVNNFATGPNFGLALYGRKESDQVGFPGSTPLAETGRQVQIALKISF